MRTFVVSAELSASGEIFIRDFLYKLFSSVQQARYVAPVPPRAPYRALGMPFAPPRPYKGCYGRYCVPCPRETARMATATTRIPAGGDARARRNINDHVSSRRAVVASARGANILK